jgi:hypothetical protein
MARPALIALTVVISLQADHSERMLRERYREVVSAGDAQRYWEIRPL